jgi:hypothetical protein
VCSECCDWHTIAQGSLVHTLSLSSAIGKAEKNIGKSLGSRGDCDSLHLDPALAFLRKIKLGPTDVLLFLITLEGNQARDASTLSL